MQIIIRMIQRNMGLKKLDWYCIIDIRMVVKVTIVTKVTTNIWRCIEEAVTSLTRNQVIRKGTWVRIPPSPFSKIAENLVIYWFSAIVIIIIKISVMLHNKQNKCSLSVVKRPICSHICSQSDE